MNDWAPYTFPYRYRSGDPLVFPVVGDRENPRPNPDGANYMTVEAAGRELKVRSDTVIEYLRAGHLVAHWALLNETAKRGVPMVNRNSVENYRKQRDIRRTRNRERHGDNSVPESP